MRLTCEQCGVEYVAKRATARFCSTRCRTRAARARAGVVPGVTTIPVAPAPDATVQAATLATLREVDRESTPLGRAALVIAERVDARMDTGSALAQLAKQLQATLEAATANTSTVVSPMDELRLRREHRRGA